MGLRIGDIPTTLFTGRVEVRTDDSRRDQSEQTQFFGRSARRQEEIRAGFGENTVSIPGAAIQAVGRNLTEARNLVPSIEELATRQRERSAERQAEARADLQARQDALRENRREPVVRIDFQRAEAQARAQTRQFVNNVNAAAGQARSRIEGTPPPPEGPRATVEVAGEAFSFTPPTAAQFDFRG